jgi:transposase
MTRRFTMPKRECRTYTEEFKNQIVQLYLNHKPRQDIIREYDLTSFTFDKWMKQNQTKQNQHKYSVSAMCRVLKIVRSTFYYESQNH